jgi:phospholipid transport system substrate-binding protein
MNRLLLTVALLLPLYAQAATDSVVATGPAAPISALDAGLAATMKAAASESFSARFAALAPVVDHSFDLAAVLRVVVGLRWASLPAAQQASLLSAFRAYTVAQYVSNFASNDGTHFALLPDQRSVGSDVVVESQVVPGNGDPPTRIDYVVRMEADGWHAVDVLLEGTISQAAVQRSDFRSFVDDGDASRLIASLNQKVSDLSKGSSPG